MNILYLCDEYPPGRHGGIGTAVQLLAREMVCQGHKVVVAGFYDWGYGEKDYFVDEGVEVHRFRRRLDSSLLKKQDMLPVRAMYKLLKVSGIFHIDIEKSLERYKEFLEKLIKQYAIDVIEMPDYNDYMRFANKAVYFPELSVPVVVKLHGSMTYIARENNVHLPQFIYDMEADIMQKASAIVSVSEYGVGKLREYFNYDKPVAVLHNGINIKEIDADEPKVPGKVIFTGTLNENKGIYQLIKAWNLVKAKVPDAELTVFGKGPVQKIQAYLKPEVLPSVSFKGHVPRKELFKELCSASVAVFPSYAENFAFAPMEAMACGTAVVYTSRSSGPELITNKVNGMLVDPGDTDEIADAITYLLQNPDVCVQFAKEGKKRVIEEFDIKTVAQKHIVFYQKLINDEKVNG